MGVLLPELGMTLVEEPVKLGTIAVELIGLGQLGL